MTDLFIAVGASGKLATSPDGVTWTLQTSGFGTDEAQSVAYGNGLWVAVGTSGKLATSPDGVTWTQRTSSFGTTQINDVAYGSGLWVAVGNSGKLATSPDGVTWTQRTSSFGTSAIWTIAYGDGLLVAASTDGKLATSPDGVTWTQRTSSFGTTSITSVAYGSGTWVAVGDLPPKIATSPDGVTWTQQTQPFDVPIDSVSYGNGLWVATGNTAELAISTDGVTWATQTTGFGTSAIYAVAYGQKTWVIAGDSGKLATSPDGVTWTQRTSSFGTTVIAGVGWSSTPSNAPTLVSPISNTTIAVNQDQTFVGTFSDNDANATMTAFQIQYRVAGSSTWTKGSIAVGSSSVETVTAGTLVTATNYEWQARTWNDSGVVGPWSASAFFTGGTAPDPPTITNPVDGATLTAEVESIAWATAVQDEYQWRRVADDGSGNPVTGTVYQDSGQIVSTANSATVRFETNSRTEHFELRVFTNASGLWSTWVDARYIIAYTPPAMSVVTCVAKSDASPPSIEITIDNPTPTGSQPTVTSVDIYRRVMTDGGDGQRLAAGLSPGETWNDYRAASREVYQYQAVANASSNSTSSSSGWTP